MRSTIFFTKKSYCACGPLKIFRSVENFLKCKCTFMLIKKVYWKPSFTTVDFENWLVYLPPGNPGTGAYFVDFSTRSLPPLSSCDFPHNTFRRFPENINKYLIFVYSTRSHSRLASWPNFRFYAKANLTYQQTFLKIWSSYDKQNRSYLDLNLTFAVWRPFIICKNLAKQNGCFTTKDR